MQLRKWRLVLSGSGGEFRYVPLGLRKPAPDEVKYLAPSGAVTPIQNNPFGELT